MENNPLISVIVPVYNVEKYIHKCIDSIINQTYKNLEIILVDDGSPDNCGKICDEYADKDERIKVIHKLNGGLSDARNEGLKLSKGDYITFVDSDDWIDLDLYEKILRKADSSNDIIIFGLRHIELNGCREFIPYIPKPNYLIEINDEDIIYLINLIKTSMLGYVCNKIYRKEIIKNINFDDIRLREDICFNFKILRHTKCIRCVDICGYNYLQQQSSILHKSSIKNLEDINKVEKILNEGIEGINEKNNSVIYNKIMQIYLSDIIIRDIIRNGEITEEEKFKYIKKIFSYRNIVNKLKVRLSDNRLSLFMVICMKLNRSRLFYKIIRFKNL